MKTKSSNINNNSNRIKEGQLDVTRFELFLKQNSQKPNFVKFQLITLE